MEGTGGERIGTEVETRRQGQGEGEGEDDSEGERGGEEKWKGREGKVESKIIKREKWR